MEGEEVKVYIYSFSPPLCLEGHFQPNPTCLPSGFSSATSHPAPTWFTLPPSFFLRHLHVSDAAFSIFSVACFHFCLHLQTMSPHVHFFNKMYSVMAVCQLPPYAPGLQKWLDTTLGVPSRGLCPSGGLEDPSKNTQQRRDCFRNRCGRAWCLWGTTRRF